MSSCFVDLLWCESGVLCVYGVFSSDLWISGCVCFGDLCFGILGI